MYQKRFLSQRWINNNTNLHNTLDSDKKKPSTSIKIFLDYVAIHKAVIRGIMKPTDKNTTESPLCIKQESMRNAYNRAKDW